MEVSSAASALEPNMFQNVCRLCSGKQNLHCVFNDILSSSMPNMIAVTSGVEIKKSDVVSQMVCKMCCEITIKMFKFRTTCIMNDKELKTKSMEYQVAKLVNLNKQGNQVDYEPPNKPKPSPNLANNEKSVSGFNKTTALSSKYKGAHPSIKDVVKKNPRLILPSECLKSHVGAYITLLTNEVDEWFKERKFSDEEIARMKKQAARSPNSGTQPNKSIRLSEGTKETVSGKTDKITPHSTNSKTKSKELTSSNEVVIGKQSVKGKNHKCTPPTTTKRKHTLNVTSFPKRTKLSGGVGDHLGSKDMLDLDKRSVGSSDGSQIKEKKERRIGENSAKANSGTADIKPELIQPKILLPSDLSKKHISKTSVAPSTVAQTETAALKPQLIQPNAHLPSDISRNDNTKTTVPPSTVTQTESAASKPQLIQPKTLLPSDLSKKDSTKSSVPPSSVTPQTETAASKPQLIQPIAVLLSDLSEKGITKSSVSPSSVTQTKTAASKPQLIQPNVILPSDLSRKDIAKSSVPPSSVTPQTETAASQDGSSSVEDKLPNKEGSDIVSMNIRMESRISSTEDSTETDLTVDLKLGNIPDSTLWTPAKKSSLYICIICDCHYSTSRDLHKHLQKRHMTCRFCKRTFRSSAILAEHINFSCIKNKNHKTIKEVKVLLSKVDKDKTIRKQYPSAFEENDSEVRISQDEIESSVNNPCDAGPTKTVSELQEFLDFRQSNDTEMVQSETQGETQLNAALSESVIYISDEESEPIESTKNDNICIIQTVDNDILNKMDVRGSDVYILKEILKQTKLKKKTYCAFKKFSIVDGRSSRTKIFKNLNIYMRHYKIPIEMKHDSKFSVEYTLAKPTGRKTCKDLWNTIVPTTLQTFSSSTEPTSTAAPNFTTINVNGPVVYQTNNNMINQLSLGTYTGTQKNIATSNRLMLSTGSILKSVPLVITGNQNVCPTTGTFTILVPNSLIQKSSPLPVSAGSTYVTSPCINTFQTTMSACTNTFMNVCNNVPQTKNAIPQPTVTSKQQPTIRVKSLKKLV